jgi:glycogen operon protein
MLLGRNGALFLSQGVPMLVAGDEMGRTQQGNNNAYCQDNEISWINWDAKDEQLMEFSAGLINFRLAHPAFCRNKWFQHKSIKGIKDIEWFLPEGTTMSDEHWNESMAKSLGVFLSGDHIGAQDEHGDVITDDSFFVIFNSNHESVVFTIPDKTWGEQWFKILDTNDGFFNAETEEFILSPGEHIEAAARSVTLLTNKRKRTGES